MNEEAKATYIADLDYFQTLIEESKDPTLLLPIMFINTRLQKFDEVIHVAGKAISTFPKHTQLQALYANALIETGRKEDALDVLFDIVMSDEDNYMALKLLGKIYKGMGDKESALKYVRAAYLKAPEDSELFEWLDELGGLNIVDGKMPAIALPILDEPVEPQKEFAVDEQIAEAEKAIANLVQDMDSFTFLVPNENSDAIIDNKKYEPSAIESSPLEGPELSDDEIFDTLITDTPAIHTINSDSSNKPYISEHIPFTPTETANTNSPQLDMSVEGMDSFFANITGTETDDNIDTVMNGHLDGDTDHQKFDSRANTYRTYLNNDDSIMGADSTNIQNNTANTVLRDTILNETEPNNLRASSIGLDDDSDDDANDDFFDLSKLSTVLGDIEDNLPEQQDSSNMHSSEYDDEGSTNFLHSFIKSDTIRSSNSNNISTSNDLANNIMKSENRVDTNTSIKTLNDGNIDSFEDLINEPLLKEPVLEHIVPEEFKPATISAHTQQQIKEEFEKKQLITSQKLLTRNQTHPIIHPKGETYSDTLNESVPNDETDNETTDLNSTIQPDSAAPLDTHEFNPITLDNVFNYDVAGIEGRKPEESLQMGSADYDPYTQAQHDSVKSAYQEIVMPELNGMAVSNTIQEDEDNIQILDKIDNKISTETEESFYIEPHKDDTTNIASSVSSVSSVSSAERVNTYDNSASPLQFLDKMPSLKDMPDELDNLSNIDGFKLYENDDGVNLLSLLDNVDIEDQDTNVDSKLAPAIVIEHTNIFDSKSYAMIASAIIADIDKAIEKTAEFDSNDIINTETITLDIGDDVEKYDIFNHTDYINTSINMDTSDTLERSEFYDKDEVKQPTQIKLDLDSSLLDTNEGIFSLLSDLHAAGDRLEVSDLMIEHNEWLGVDESDIEEVDIKASIKDNILYSSEDINKSLLKKTVDSNPKPTVILPSKLSDAKSAPRIEDPRKKGSQKVSVQDSVAKILQQKEFERQQRAINNNEHRQERQELKPRVTTDGKEIVRPTIKTITELPTQNIISDEEQAKIDQQLALLTPITNDAELVLGDNGSLVKVEEHIAPNDNNVSTIELDGIVERTPEFDHAEANTLILEPITVQQKAESNLAQSNTVDVKQNENLINTADFADLVMDDLINEEPAPKDDFERFIAEQKKLKEEKLKAIKITENINQSPTAMNQADLVQKVEQNVQLNQKQQDQVLDAQSAEDSITATTTQSIQSTQVPQVADPKMPEESVKPAVKNLLISSPSLNGPRYTKPTFGAGRPLTPEEASIINESSGSSTHMIVDDDDEISALSSFIVEAPTFHTDDNTMMIKSTYVSKQGDDHDASLDDNALQAQLSSYIIDQANLPDNEEILKNIAKRSKIPEVSTVDEDFVLYDKNETYFKDAEIRDALEKSAHKTTSDSNDDPANKA